MSFRSFLIGSMMAIAWAGTAAAAPVQWATSSGGNGHWYDFVSGSTSFATASSAAAASSLSGTSGHLVTITSAAEQAFIDTNFGNAGFYWLGASDAASEGTWEWIAGPETGQLLSAGYDNWAQNEPNNFVGVEDHAVGNWNSLGQWNDVGNFSASYIVEFSVAAVPLPPALPLFAIGLGLLGLAARRRKFL